MTVANVLNESFFARSVKKIMNIFSAGYESSFFKKIVDFICTCFLSSRIYGLFSRYVNKKAFYRYSLTYRFVMAAVHLADRFFGFLHNIISKLLSGSCVSAHIRSALSASLKDKLFGFGVLFMSIPVGSLTAIVLFGETISDFSIILSWASFVFGLMLVLMGTFDEALRNSFIVRGVRAFLNILN